ncbi:MAG: electron transfer flavoprotein subunit alpha/FixB family protein [Chloroflexi bacterium]|nr:electron transfer flavoprotein subunit alpha/FixB family protein [Chloroflexota bacterium]
MSGILIFAETDDGTILPNFWEQVSAARQVADPLGGGLRVAVQGSQIKDASDALKSGAEQVYVTNDARLGEPWSEAHLETFTALCRELQPELIILPRTLLGMEIAARLAQRLDAGLAQDVMTMQLAEGKLTVTRPVFGGAASATLRLTRPPWIIVPRTGAFAPAEPLSTPKGELVARQANLVDDALKTRRISRTRQTSKINLERARVIISGGRGLGGPEPFQLLHEIAERMGAVVGASRPPCDSGWVDSGMQVGLTGKTVSPEVYIAVGISGATQHMTGCSSSRVIVAINQDPDAPIFRMATYGVVGDWKQVLPGFCEALA